MRTRHLILAAALALALGTTACSSGDDDEVAAGDDAAAAAESFDSPGDAALAFSQCMRDEGIEDFPDPQIDGGRVQLTPGAIDPNDPDVAAAQEVCSPLLEQGGNVEVDEERQAEMREAALAFAECMRSHGIDFPDPQVDGGRVTMGGPGVDPNSPEFQDAQSACQAEVPELGAGAQP